MARLLLRSRSAAQSDVLLVRIASGDEIVTSAWLEPEGGFGPRGIRTTATADGDGFRLDGTKWHVPFAGAATRLVVLARTGDADDAVDLFLVDPDAVGVERAQQFTLASETQYAVTPSGVRVTE